MTIFWKILVSYETLSYTLQNDVCHLSFNTLFLDEILTWKFSMVSIWKKPRIYKCFKGYQQTQPKLLVIDLCVLKRSLLTLKSTRSFRLRRSQWCSSQFQSGLETLPIAERALWIMMAIILLALTQDALKIMPVYSCDTSVQLWHRQKLTSVQGL